MRAQCVNRVAPPGFCNRGEVRYGSIGGLDYEVPQSRLYCLCINVALCSTALQCICRVIRRSYMTMKAHTYYIIFGRPPIGGKLPPLRGGATASTTQTWLRRKRIGKRLPQRCGTGARARVYTCCLPEFRCLQKSSDNLCAELAKNQTRELSQTLMKHED